MSVIKKLSCFLGVTILLSFCSDCFSQKVISKPLPDNPTSYIFKMKINDAARSLEKGYNASKGARLHVEIY